MHISWSGILATISFIIKESEQQILTGNQTLSEFEDLEIPPDQKIQKKRQLPKDYCYHKIVTKLSLFRLSNRQLVAKLIYFKYFQQHRNFN
jgi:hypothetical protein